MRAVCIEPVQRLAVVGDRRADRVLEMGAIDGQRVRRRRARHREHRAEGRAARVREVDGQAIGGGGDRAPDGSAIEIIDDPPAWSRLRKNAIRSSRVREKPRSLLAVLMLGTSVGVAPSFDGSPRARAASGAAPDFAVLGTQQDELDAGHDREEEDGRVVATNPDNRAGCLRSA
jgi:hypothetical protein